MVTMESLYRKSPPGYLGYPSPTPCKSTITLFSQTVGSHPQSKLASQIVAKRCQIQGTLYRQTMGTYTIALPNSTIIDSLGVLLP